MKLFRQLTALGLALPLIAGLTSHSEAHRQWMLPSATVLSGSDDWVTVDAAVSNDLFYFEHVPMRLDNLVVTAPDGTTVEAENKSTGRYRSTFDVRLGKPGTYRVAVVNNGIMASYTENGQPKRWRGTPEAFAREVPAGAQDLRVSQTAGRVETFVTSRAPNDAALKPTGVGLEMVPVTHPNDIVAGETASFRLLLDGKPAAGIEVEFIPGGIRYRDKLNETKIKTDADGKFSVTPAQPGMYWMEASVTDNKVAVPQATQRRAMYAATLEVLPQ